MSDNFALGKVAAGHHLAAEAAAGILRAGGNAVDAGVAGGIALSVVQSDYVNFGGVAPLMIRRPDGSALTIDGLGPWPAAADPEVFCRDHAGTIPAGILRSVIPAAPAAWIAALKAAGTMSFGEVARPAIALARDGFPMHWIMRTNIEKHLDSYARWNSNAAIYLPRGKIPELGDTFVQTDLASTIQFMADADHAAGGGEAGLSAARAAFYEGDVADAIARYHAANGGWITQADLASYEVDIGVPVNVAFADGIVMCSGAWSQGPFLGQLMCMLDQFDWTNCAPQSAPWMHRVIECVKLAFADREAVLGDPRFTDVPLDMLLSDDHIAAQLLLFDPARAMPDMPKSKLADHVSVKGQKAQNTIGDTSYIAVVDNDGLAFSATPSDVSYTGPVIPGLGICVSPRGSASWVEPTHPSSLKPGKRPRLTCNPAIWVGGDGTVMPFGTPGGDMQVQTMAQFLLNRIVHGMPLQEAAEAPRAGSYSFPSSFAPHDSHPGLVRTESALAPDVRETLSRLGHRVETWPDRPDGRQRSHLAGAICAVERKPDGALNAAADPRRPTGVANA
jgi:gamma-glutamyltranspeptidase/glutathione hydrolase